MKLIPRQQIGGLVPLYKRAGSVKRRKAASTQPSRETQFVQTTIEEGKRAIRDARNGVYGRSSRYSVSQNGPQSLKEIEQKRIAAYDNAHEKNKKYVKKGDWAYSKSEQQIMQMQRKMQAEGLYKGKIDGVWGNDSKTAYTRYADLQRRRKSTPINAKKSNTSLNQKEDAQSNNQNIYNGPNSYFVTDKPEDKVGNYIMNYLGQQFPLVRQLVDFRLGNKSGETQTNDDFSQSYLENLSQLGQVAYRQYVRRNGYPRPGTTINLPLSASVYKEINPSGRYADFSDVLGMLNGAVGGDRQVEYTDGGMSGKLHINEDGTGTWNLSDETSFAFDPGQKEKLQKRLYEPGKYARYSLGVLDEHNDERGYTPTKQKLTVTFPTNDTIQAYPARYSNTPKIKQK